VKGGGNIRSALHAGTYKLLGGGGSVLATEYESSNGSVVGLSLLGRPLRICRLLLPALSILDRSRQRSGWDGVIVTVGGAASGAKRSMVEIR
jgi:hypothetical protein